MTIAFLVQFLIILLAVLAAGAAGYMLALYRTQADTDQMNAQMSAEIMKMRRRAATAESDASNAYARLARERRKQRRNA